MTCKMIRLKRLQITDSMMTWIASGCRDLQLIDLSDCDRVNDLTLSYLLEGCTRLKTIKLNNCQGLTSIPFENLNSSSGTFIEELHLSGCINLMSASIAVIAKACPNMKVLHLKNIPLLDDIALTSIANYCHYLSTLDLSFDIKYSSSTGKVSRIAKGLGAIGRNCSRLLVLRCNGSSRLKDKCIIAVTKGCPFLEELAIKQCQRITDLSLKHIGARCQQMKHIFLSSCREISDIGIKYLTSGCPILETIDLFSVDKLTDEGVQTISTCKELTSLTLRNCYRLTDRSVSRIIDACSNLEKIDLSGVEQLSNLSLKDLHSKCPLLRTANFWGSEIDDNTVKMCSTKLNFGVKAEEKCVIKCMYKDYQIHLQHKKVILMSFSSCKYNHQCLMNFFLLE